jgi:hypothetical protein
LKSSGAQARRRCHVRHQHRRRRATNRRGRRDRRAGRARLVEQRELQLALAGQLIVCRHPLVAAPSFRSARSTTTSKTASARTCSSAYSPTAAPTAGTSPTGYPPASSDAPSREPLRNSLDDSRKCSVVNRDATRHPDSQTAAVPRLGCNRGVEHRLALRPVTIQHVR